MTGVGLIELVVILALIALNGLFAVSEFAIVLSRHSRLNAMEGEGRRGARDAIALASNPQHFLSAVQVGITLVSIANGAYAAEIYGDNVANYLEWIGVSVVIAEPVGFGIVIVVVTYFSVIAGELVPKNLALRNPEAIACFIAPTMSAFSKLAAPAVWLLNWSTQLVLRISGQATRDRRLITDEEIQALIAEAETTGVLEKEERQMISGVMQLADSGVGGLMTPRKDVEWIDITTSKAEVKERLIKTSHSRLPAADGSIDKIAGVIHTQELLAAILDGKPFDLQAYIRMAPVIPEIMDALDVVSVLREAEVPMALIHDEYGHFEGLIVPADILEAIAGVFKYDSSDIEPDSVERDDGTWLFSGSMSAIKMAGQIGIVLPEIRSYETVAGFVLANLQHLPKTGEHIDTNGWRFEVMDIDGRRIDKVLASRSSSLSRRGL